MNAIETARALTPLNSFDKPPVAPTQYEEVENWRAEAKRQGPAVLSQLRALRSENKALAGEAHAALLQVTNLILDPEFCAAQATEIDRIADALFAGLPQSERDRAEFDRKRAEAIREEAGLLSYWESAERTPAEVHALLARGDDALRYQKRLNFLSAPINRAVVEWFLATEKPGNFQTILIPDAFVFATNADRLQLLHRFPCVHNFGLALERRWESFDEAVFTECERLVAELPAKPRRHWKTKLTNARNWHASHHGRKAA